MKRFLLLLSLCIVVGSCSVWADTVGTTNPALFNDIVDWSQLGTVGSVFTGFVPWISAGGNTGIVFSSPDFELMQQGVTWAGNFSDQMYLLWNEGSGSNIVASFNQPVYGAGAFIQTDFFGLFDATVSLLDSSFNTLGSFTATGVSNALGDGSALFVGMLDTALEVHGVSFSAVGTDPISGNLGSQDFAIGTMKTSAVPEPTTLLLLGTGLGVICLTARRRARKH